MYKLPEWIDELGVGGCGDSIADLLNKNIGFVS